VLDDVLCEDTKELELRLHPASTVCAAAEDIAVAVGEQTGTVASQP